MFDYNQALAAERDQIAAQDRDQKAMGFTHKAVAWIHPARGDDYQVDIYYKGEPREKDVTETLKSRGSPRLDDYSITVI